jgi:hypothetical protein
MNPETRQTLIGVAGLTVVEVTALMEGYNGRVATVYFISVLGMVAPQAIDQLPVLGNNP